MPGALYPLSHLSPFADEKMEAQGQEVIDLPQMGFECKSSASKTGTVVMTLPRT